MSLFQIFLSVGVVLVIVEMITPTSFIFFSLGIAALGTAIVSIVISNIALLIGVFAALSMFIFYFLRKKDIFKTGNNYKSNVESYFDKEVVVTSIIGNNQYRVKIYGEEWTAECFSDLKIGDKVFVDTIDGNKLILKLKN